jgi:hypothetical protein
MQHITQEKHLVLCSSIEKQDRLRYLTRLVALKLLKETYRGQLKITENERFSDWQAAKKVYHASEFGVNSENYGMTKEQLRQINKVCTIRKYTTDS